MVRSPCRGSRSKAHEDLHAPVAVPRILAGKLAQCREDRRITPRALIEALDKLQRNEARVEFVPLKRQYLHLAPLVGVA